MRKKPYKREIYRGRGRSTACTNAEEVEYLPHSFLPLDYSKALEGWEMREKNEGTQEEGIEKPPVLKKTRSFFSKILGKEE